jgi:hypothetical protein
VIEQLAGWSVDVDRGKASGLERAGHVVAEALVVRPREIVRRVAPVLPRAGVGVRGRGHDEVNSAERLTGQQGLLKRAMADVDHG